MSSDEGGSTSPVLPKDSDPGSSVSSELQDEYEELLRFAMVTPKLDGQATAGAHLQPSQLSASGEARRLHGKEEVTSQRQAGVIPNVGDDRRSRAGVRTSSPHIAVDTHTLHSQSRASHVEELAGQSSGGGPSGGGPSSDRGSRAAAVERSRQTGLDPWESGGTELFITEESIGKIEEILDTWSNHLKSNVLTELRRWRLALVEQHKLGLRRERERCTAQTASLRSELGDLKDLLGTYETSNQRKDQVIMNLSKVLDRQKEKLETMRAFSTWRVQHSQAKEEAHAAKVAQQHYHLQLKKRVWLGWHGLLRGHWKEQVERACRARAEEVCERLSADYEARIAQQRDALEDAQAEIQKLRADRERYGESVKTAFMRGVCALNMEAMSMFHPAAEGLPEPPVAAGTAAHHLHHHHHQHGDDRRDGIPLSPPPPQRRTVDWTSSEDAPPPPPPDERGSSSLAPLAPLAQQPWERPVSSSRFDSVIFDPPSAHPSHGEAGFMLGSSAPVTRPEASTTVIHSSLPLGGTAGTHRQGAGGRVTTTVVGHQRPSKTVTARVSARPDLGIARPGRGGTSSLHVMSMTPPMSSVIVERHHPVAQLNIGQSAAVSKHMGHHSLPTATRGQSSAPSRGHTHPSTCHMHSIKVVE